MKGKRQKKGTPTGVPFTYGAGYGNRTRLCGLGSDHSTDELTLRDRCIIADCPGNFNTQFAELFRRLPRLCVPAAASRWGPGIVYKFPCKSCTTYTKDKCPPGREFVGTPY